MSPQTRSWYRNFTVTASTVMRSVSCLKLNIILKFSLFIRWSCSWVWSLMVIKEWLDNSWSLLNDNSMCSLATIQRSFRLSYICGLHTLQVYLYTSHDLRRVSNLSLRPNTLFIKLMVLNSLED